MIKFTDELSVMRKGEGNDQITDEYRYLWLFSIYTWLMNKFRELLLLYFKSKVFQLWLKLARDILALTQDFKRDYERYMSGLVSVSFGPDTRLKHYDR